MPKIGGGASYLGISHNLEREKKRKEGRKKEKDKITSVKDVEKLQLLCTAGGNAKCYSSSGKQRYGVSS